MAKLAQSLTDRDLQILMMVYSYHGCGIDHIRAKFFKDSGRSTPCYRRISRLVQQGFLTRIRLPSQTGVGSGKFLLNIGPSGRVILSDALGLSRSELTRARMDSPNFISHHLALCDVRLCFELAAERSLVFDLQEWIGDWELHQSPMKVTDPITGKKLTIIPDATFTLSLSDGTKQRFFLEMDMGTVAPKRMVEKLRGYLLPREDPSPVIFVVPDYLRQTAVLHWSLEQARELSADSTVFWIGVRESIDKNTVLASAIWKIVGGPEAVALEMLAGGASQPDGEIIFPRTRAIGGHRGLPL